MKKPRKSTYATVLFLCILPFQFLFAQRDIKGELKQDVVKIENDQYSIEEYGDINTFDKTYQVKISASAPVSLLSRDNFMRYYGALSSTLFSTWLSHEGLKVPDNLMLIRVEKPAERIDLNVTISMSEKGIDCIIQTNNSKEKINLQWQYQLFTDTSH